MNWPEVTFLSGTVLSAAIALLAFYVAAHDETYAPEMLMWLSLLFAFALVVRIVSLMGLLDRTNAQTATGIIGIGLTIAIFFDYYLSRKRRGKWVWP